MLLGEVGGKFLTFLRCGLQFLAQLRHLLGGGLKLGGSGLGGVELVDDGGILVGILLEGGYERLGVVLVYLHFLRCCGLGGRGVRRGCVLLAAALATGCEEKGREGEGE